MSIEEKYNILIVKYKSFEFFPEEEKTREICKYACEKHWCHLRFIENQTYRMCINACKKISNSVICFKKPITKNIFKIISKEKDLSSHLFYFYYDIKKFYISKETIFYLKKLTLYCHLLMRLTRINNRYNLKKTLSYYYF
jgi:hypothetical protein